MPDDIRIGIGRMNHWYYNVRNRETDALIAFRVPAGMLDGADRQQAQAHIKRMNETTLTLQSYELFEEEERRQTQFSIQSELPPRFS